MNVRLLCLTIVFVASPLWAAEKTAPNVSLSEWERGFAVRSLKQKGMSVYLWFYEWNMFEAMQPGQHTRGTYKLDRKLNRTSTRGLITSDALELSMTAVADGAELKLTVRNRTNYDFPPVAAIIPCFNPGPRATRNKQFANTNTYFLSAKGLGKLIKREIHFNHVVRPLVDKHAKAGKYIWTEKWPLNNTDSVGGLIVRESTDGKWVCGIAWEEFLSAQGHNPWECMHLSVRVGPLKRGKSKTIRGKIYLFQGDKEDLLRRYRVDFGQPHKAK